LNILSKRVGIFMTMRFYAALTIALSCGLSACSTAPVVPETGSSGQMSAAPGSKSDPQLALAKGHGEAASSDVTGSVPAKEVSKSKSSAAENAAVTATTSRRDSQKTKQQSTSEATRRLDVNKTATRKLDEPLYQPGKARLSQAQRLSSEPSIAAARIAGDPANAMALASSGTAPAREIPTGSILPASNRSKSISLSYQSDAIELSDKDRRNVIVFVTQRDAKDTITVVTGPSVGTNPLEGMLRSQERGRRVGELLAAHGPVEIRFEPDLPRDSVRID
jgi:hypothetical protein